MNLQIIQSLLLTFGSGIGFAFTKVLVPAVYKEWVESGPPLWAVSDDIMASHNYSVFLYQKVNESEPNFISTNFGRENGVYFKYIA
jgi:hypothetical protein